MHYVFSFRIAIIGHDFTELSALAHSAGIRVHAINFLNALQALQLSKYHILYYTF